MHSLGPLGSLPAFLLYCYLYEFAWDNNKNLAGEFFLIFPDLYFVRKLWSEVEDLDFYITWKLYQNTDLWPRARKIPEGSSSDIRYIAYYNVGPFQCDGLWHCVACVLAGLLHPLREINNARVNQGYILYIRTLPSSFAPMGFSDGSERPTAGIIS